LRWRPYGRKQPIIDDLDLVIPAGQRVLLVGPSGSGKSTLLRGLAGLLETADAGELTGAVTIDGAAPGDRPGAVGLVLQEPGAGLVAATIARDVAFGLENIGMPRADMPPRVTTALAAVRLTEGLAPDAPTSALSGGQTQRLALAGALALEPSVLMLDEPTAMLDADNAAAVRASVDAVVSERALTLVVVEHVLGPWVDLVDRLLVLDDQGRIVADGPVRETLVAERERLLEMGVWVPGAPVPDPIPVDPTLLRRC
jgi:energy-coupling factor transport system ATP-binding protein